MVISNNAKIFLSSDRAVKEEPGSRTFNTFNFGDQFNRYKEAFGSLYVLNDDTLDAGESLTVDVREDSIVYVLPIVGAVECKTAMKKNSVMEPGKIAVFTLSANQTITYQNPYSEGLINFIQVWVKTSGAQRNTNRSIIFDLFGNKNQLIPLEPKQDIADPLIFIGQFDGRAEAIYHLRKPGNDLFAFVIEGAFELEGRLLHQRDGLALWNINAAEIEALSNEAIIFLIELPVK